MKTVIIGYGEMFRAVISGVLKTQNEIIGVFRHENIIYPPLRRMAYDIIKPTCDYDFIKKNNLKEIHASSVNSGKFTEKIKKSGTDIIFVCSWSEKFSERIINAPSIACINVHPSLLPKYRGPNPYMQVILNNEKQTGVTFHLMDKSFDTGEIIHQAAVDIGRNDTGGTLKTKCCNLAEKEIINLLGDFDNKLKNKKPQNEDNASYYPHILLSESILDFTKETADETDRRIRALNPWLKCHICYKDEFFSFKSHKILSEISAAKPASIIAKTENSLSIVCKDGGIIKFSGLKIKRPLCCTKFYLNKIIKINERAI